MSECGKVIRVSDKERRDLPPTLSHAAAPTECVLHAGVVGEEKKYFGITLH